MCVLVLLCLTLPLWAQPSPSPEETPTPSKSPAASASPSFAQIDQAATGRLREMFRQVPGLRGVTLEIRGGVAILRGEVNSFESAQEASKLAQKLDGVVAVDNGLTVVSDVRERISPALTKLSQKGMTFISFLPLFGIAIVVVFLFVALGRLLVRWDWLFSRFSSNVFVTDLLKHATQLFCLGLGFLIALELLEATALVGAVLGTAGVLGVAIGFAFQDMAENSLASILLSIRQPFAPNDLVEIDGRQGKVVRLTSRATILLTLDGNHLRIPNATVFKATILNYTRNPERRFTFTVGIDTEQSIPKAQALAIRVLTDSPGVVSHPPANCLVETLGDSTVNLTMIGWVDQRQSDFNKARSEAIRRVKEAFDQADIIMPEPIYKVRLEQAAAVAPTVNVDESSTPSPVPYGDVAPERHLEERINQERDMETDDLLGRAGKQE